MSVHDVQCGHESASAPGGHREVGQGGGDAEPRQEAGHRCNQVSITIMYKADINQGSNLIFGSYHFDFQLLDVHYLH